MNILIISQHYWPENFGINEVVKALKHRGCNITVLSGHPNYPSGHVYAGYDAWKINRQLHPVGYEIFRVPIIPRGRGRRRDLVANYLSFVVTASLLAPLLLRRRRYDVVLVYALSPILQGIPAVILARLKHAPLVAWIQDLWPDSLAATGRVRSELVLSTVKIITRWIYRQCAMLLVQSEAFVDEVRPLAGDEVPIVYHPNAGELGLENTDNANLPDRFTVLYAGNVGAAQSISTIVGAAEKLLSIDPTIDFLIAGSGSCLAWLENEIATLKLSNITLLGRVPVAEMPAIYEKASALLVTLSAHVGLSQTIPSKIQSYLAVGKPIIGALDGEGARLIKKAGAGIVVPAEDEQALVGALLTLKSKSTPYLRAMGNAGREYYEAHFAPTALIDQLVEHLTKAIDGRICNRTNQSKTKSQ